MLLRYVSEVVASGIQDNLEWTTNSVEQPQDGNYTVNATASVTLNINIPAAGELSYTASQPFRIRVDVENRTVVDWSFNQSVFSLEEK